MEAAEEGNGVIEKVEEIRVVERVTRDVLNSGRQTRKRTRKKMREIERHTVGRKKETVERRQEREQLPGE